MQLWCEKSLLDLDDTPDLRSLQAGILETKCLFSKEINVPFWYIDSLNEITLAKMVEQIELHQFLVLHKLLFM